MVPVYHYHVAHHCNDIPIFKKTLKGYNYFAYNLQMLSINISLFEMVHDMEQLFPSPHGRKRYQISPVHNIITTKACVIDPS